MKSGIFIAVAGVAVSSVTALSFPRATQGKGYISMPVNVVKRDLSSLTKRDAVEVAIKNRAFYYSTDIMIGTPGQLVSVLLDTGSSELWVNPDCSTAPSSSQAKQCSLAGQYNPRNSRTPPTGPFGGRRLNYGDPSDPSTQTSAEISYYSDAITMSAGVVINQTFGVVTKSDGISTGIMGLAPDLSNGFTPDEPYSLLLNSLADQGVIQSRVFSLDLRHSSADNGALVYGGLDRGKFIGQLQSVPLTNGAKGEPRLAVRLTSIGINLPDADPKVYPLGTADKNVMLDSGTTLTRLHPALARPILADLKAVSDSDGYWTADCSLRTQSLATGGSDGFVTFTFGIKTIQVPLSDFILDLGPRSGQCYVGLVITTDQQILGDSVLRAGYFVFDWDNQAVHIAQAATCGKDEILAVGKGKDAVPTGVMGLCDGPATPDGTGDSSTSAVSPPSSTSSSVGPAVTLKLNGDSSTSISASSIMTPTSALPAAIKSTDSLTPPSQESKTTSATPSSSPTSKAGAKSSSSGTAKTAAPTTPSSSTSSDSHSVASSFGRDASHFGLLLGSMVTLAVAFLNA